MSFSLLTKTHPLAQSSIDIHGDKYAAHVAMRLTEASAEFHVEPLPDDQWRFTVKREHEGILADCKTCWQFFAPIMGDSEHGLFCDLQIGHGGHHNSAQRATYERALR